MRISGKKFRTFFAIFVSRPIPTGFSQNTCFRTSLVPDLCWCLRWPSKWNYPYVAWLKTTTNVHLKWILGKITLWRREENVGMRSKLPMISIGGSSATFKTSLLVLFGPYTKRLLCKFEKKKKSIAMCCDHYRNTRLDLVFVLQFTVRQKFFDVVFRPRFPSLLAASKKHLSLFWDLLINKCSLKVTVCHLDLRTEESRNYHLISCSCLETIKRFSN